MALAVIVGCFGAGCDDGVVTAGPCDGVTCSSLGSCFARGLSAFCDCEPGSHPLGLSCEPNDPGDPCLGVTCSGHGACEVEARLPRCECSPGFEPDPSGMLCFDRGEPCTPAPAGPGVSLPGTAGTPQHRSLVWSGNGLGLAWADPSAPALTFRVMDPLGEAVGDDAALTAEPAGPAPIVWTGEEWAVIYARGGPCDPCIRDIVLRRFDQDGAPLGGEVVLDGGGDVGLPQLAWTGSGYVAVWDRRLNGVMQLLAQTLDPVGEPLDEHPVRLTSCLEHCLPLDMLWTGSRAVLAYIEGSQEWGLLRLLVLDAGARVVADPVTLSDDSSTLDVSLAWAGGRLGVAFPEKPIDGVEVSRVEVRFVALEGGAEVERVSMSDVSPGPLAAANGVFLLPLLEGEAWRLVLLDATGASVGDDVPLIGGGMSAAPRLAWADGWWALVYARLVDEITSEIVYDRLDCAGAE